jgi:drug/metabolite transporter (DMT)-like permease
MSRFVAGNAFLLLSMICGATSQLILKSALHGVDPPGLNSVSWQPFLSADRLVRGGGAMVLIVAGFAFWVLALARLELSYAYPIACSSILFVAILSAVFLGEPITLRMWAGTVLILIGVVLLTPQG